MKIIRYLLLFVIASFFFSSLFACHIYTAEAANFTYDSSDSCLGEEEVLASQNKTQNNQKFVLDFSSEISEKLSSLLQQKNTSFVFWEDLSNSQTIQLLAVVKIE